VQHAHQPGGQRLAQRVRHDQFLELGHQRPGDAGQQVGVDALLDGGQPQLIEPGDDGRAELGAGHVGQGRAAPQGQRLAEGGGRGGRVVAQLSPARRRQVLEPDDVGGPRVEHELAPGRPTGRRSARWRAPPDRAAAPA
jgi:hypothetical protein